MIGQADDWQCVFALKIGSESLPTLPQKAKFSNTAAQANFDPILPANPILPASQCGKKNKQNRKKTEFRV